MADDKPGGEDLFEDLDKFFAPIRDVDWESEEAAKPSEQPQEEHVAVRPSEAAPTSPEGTESERAAPDEDDDSWYDTGVLEPIDELLGEPATDEAADEEMVTDVEGDSITVVPSDQTGLFDAAGSDDSGSEEVGPDDLDTDTASMPSILDGDEMSEDSPSEADLEAAAEHFAGSVHLDEPASVEDASAITYEPTGAADDLFGEEEAGDIEDDILADLEQTGEAQRTVVVGAEGLGGPSWQEPTSIEVGADLDRRGPGEGERDVPAAFITGLVLVGIALGSLLIGKAAFAVVAALVVLVAQGELFGVVVKRHHQPATAVGLITGALMLAGAYNYGEPAVLAMFALGVIATFLWFLAAPAALRKGTVTNIALTLMNVAYIPLLGSFLVVTLTIDGSDGKALVLAVIGLTFVFDTAAFLAGSVWGGSAVERPLAANTSPKKSWEGLIVATIVTFIVSMALVPSFVGPFEDKRFDAFLLALVVAAAATLGDLAESLIKRDLGIKDMGSVLPGHGGLLDRIDSLLFVAPAAFLLFRVIFA